MNFGENCIIRFLKMNDTLLKGKFYAKLKGIIFFLSLAVIYSSCEKRQDKYSTQLNKDPLNEILDRYVNDGIYPFLYSRIEDSSGRVVYEHSVVNRKLLPDVSINANTWIRIWSMSKLVTISLAMDLIEENTISLKDPVSNYIPEFKDLKVAVNSDRISLARLQSKDNPCPFNLVDTDSVLKIKNLFDHTAGFYYALTGFGCIDSLFANVDAPNQKDGDELIKSLAQLPLIQHPGEIYRYGMNTTVLGLLLERATGQSLNDLVLNRITNLHNINGLRYTLPENVNLIPGFTGRDGDLRKVRDGELDLYGENVPDYHPETNLFLGGEGMLATAKGYINFMRLLFFSSSIKNKEFLSEESIKEMTSKPKGQQNDDGYNTGYAFYLTSETHSYEKNILRVGGYEKTGCWVDRKNQLIGTLFTQANETEDKIGLGSKMQNDFKQELYRQLSNYE